MNDPILAAIEERLAARRAAAEAAWSGIEISNEKLAAVFMDVAVGAVKFDSGVETTLHARQQSESWAAALAEAAERGPEAAEFLNGIYAQAKETFVDSEVARRNRAPPPPREDVEMSTSSHLGMVTPKPDEGVVFTTPSVSLDVPTSCQRDHLVRDSAHQVRHLPHQHDASAPEASLPRPSAWAVELYGPEAAAAQMRAARHPDESPPEFAERVRQGRRAARHAERVLQTTDVDPSTAGANYLRR
jgi:hypothetical protein